MEHMQELLYTPTYGIAFLPTPLDRLLSLIQACERYAEQHNLIFSTNENPAELWESCSWKVSLFQRPWEELRYMHHKTNMWLDNLFNTSFYDAPVWDMMSRSFGKDDAKTAEKNTDHHIIERRFRQHLVNWNYFLSWNEFFPKSVMIAIKN